MLVSHPQHTLYPFNAQIVSVIAPTTSETEMDRLHHLYPTVFPFSALWKKVSSEYQSLLTNVHDEDTNHRDFSSDKWIAVADLSDNFGNSFEGNRVETFTLARRELTESMIPEDVKKYIADSPFKDKYVPLSIAGVEPNPEFFFGNPTDLEFVVHSKAHVLVAIANNYTPSCDAPTNEGIVRDGCT